ncbi:TetR/AcrR family transcriptional regulator [Nocardia alba]|uniref:TetR family transcriptional regulator n=1 Tax=Nocardia alba TaxID=225051 RepID=A0A4R1F3U1_9NOCA|nr:TetR/AcrR family transcriptional regulator [Nocardia alba]TCJ88050.1 TetR family transcriptional regulator [Nocardia alba]
MTATTHSTTVGLGPRALANRRRIVAVAGVELLRNPFASMEDIAAAAGMVRRTLYGHFPTREALIDGMLDEAFEQVGRALDGIDTTQPPARATADMTVALWAVGNEFQLLLRLDEAGSRARMTDRLAPVRARLITLIAAGQADGTFAVHLPPAAMARVLTVLVLALLNAHSDGEWVAAEAARDAAVACLIAVGVDRPGAAEIAQSAAEAARP